MQRHKGGLGKKHPAFSWPGTISSIALMGKLKLALASPDCISSLFSISVYEHRGNMV